MCSDVASTTHAAGAGQKCAERRVPPSRRRVSRFVGILAAGVSAACASPEPEILPGAYVVAPGPTGAFGPASPAGPASPGGTIAQPGSTTVVGVPAGEPSTAVPVDHWAFSTPSALIPEVNDDDGWARNEIDLFVLARLDSEGLTPAPAADPEKLVRRVYLTLTGLPPSLAEIEAYAADPSDAAYERMVDGLLESPRYGEHMAAAWLDIARYSDTDGYQYDRNRPAWPWRDWVIEAFNSNMPFDQFTIEQLAGDLLPEPTERSILATAFNRNHAIQGENGLLKDSFRDRYVTDRVETLGKAWLGLTLGCAKCHDHKFDPILAQDFYGLYDCFNQIDEKDNGPTSDFQPTNDASSPLAEQIITDLDARLEALRAEEAPEGQIAELEQERTAATNTYSMRVMQDMDPGRKTLMLAQGRYDAPYGDPVECSAPGALPPFPADAPANRLGLARWLVMPEQPLTARVVVNRLWLHHFGRGIVPSIDNFGVLTPAPEHLALLDWLATHFVASGWDVKAMHRLIVTSSTFRQSSQLDETSQQLDPQNDLLARGPRYRLPAEVIRDLPLAVSGLLVERVGGAPAYPYQPAGLWEELSWEHAQLSYPRMTGESLHRRSVYTFWKKTLPPPLMTVFDAPDREVSTAYRIPSTTPLQALALLNDPQFIEAAQSLAVSSLAAASGDLSGAISGAFRRLTARTPSSRELDIMLELYASQLATAPAGVDGTATDTTEGTAADTANTPEEAKLFALSQVIRVMFNLNETITQQ